MTGGDGLRALSAITAACHVPFALAASAGAGLVGLPHPGGVGAVVAVALAATFELRAVRLLPDRACSPWRLHLVEEPYFAHWCAALGSSLPIVLYAMGTATVALARGRTPELPFGFALGAYLFVLVFAIWGVYVRRRWVVVRRIEVQIAGLGPPLDGYRIVHLSDLHIGGLTPPSWAARWIRKANEARPDLVAITGDLVTRGTHFHAVIADTIRGLAAPDGVFVSLGNHEAFDGGESFVSLLRERDIAVLRNEGALVGRGGARLYVAGVDHTGADLGRALLGRDSHIPTVLLSHDPALFSAAARVGVDLVLSGHTHGGQIGIPFFARRASLRRLGLHRKGRSTLHVHPGLGTTGPPIRLGIAPEITVLVLRPDRERRPA